MATDIVFDDIDGNTVTLSCAGLATSAANITLDNPASRKVQGGTRHALRHDSEDRLSINPDREYPGGVAVQAASVNLLVHEQHGATPMLPRRARMGDLFMVHNVVIVEARSDVPRHIAEACSLWLCVRVVGGAAQWAQVTLGNSVAGTL